MPLWRRQSLCSHIAVTNFRNMPNTFNNSLLPFQRAYTSALSTMIGQCACKSHRLVTSCSQISWCLRISMPSGSIMVAPVVAHSPPRVVRRRVYLPQVLHASGWLIDVGTTGSALTLPRLATTFITVASVTAQTTLHLSAQSNSFFGASPSFSLSLSLPLPYNLPNHFPPTHTTHFHDSTYTVLAPIHFFSGLAADFRAGPQHRSEE